MNARPLILMVLCATAALGNESYRGWCEQGGHTVTTAGMASVTKVQASYPLCTVTVYPHGSATPVPSAQVFSDNSGTVLGNPFTADSNGYFTFFVVNGHYDIKRSGTSPTWTEFDVLFADPSGNSPAVTSVSAGTGISVTGPATTPTVTNTGVTGATAGAGISVSGATGSVTFTNTWGAIPGGSQLQLLRITPNVGNATTLQFASQPVFNSADYNFPTLSPSGTLTATVAATVSLSLCPLGVAGTHTIAGNLPHLLWVAGTGTPEPVAIAGGTCTGDGITAGTLVFTPVNSHTAGWTLQSNAGGIPEAIYAAGASGSVRIAAGTITANGSIAPNGTYPLGVAAITIPSGYNTSLRGQGRYATILQTSFATGDAIRFDCAAPCTSASGGIGDLADLTIVDANNTSHTGGAMVRTRYRADFSLNNLYINNAYDGIVNEGGVRFDHRHFTVGTWHYGYEITCKDPSGAQVNYPTCLSYGTVTTPYISSGAANTHAIHIEAPTAGVSVDSPQTGSNSNSGNASVFIVAAGTNPLNEIVFGGACDLDGHAVGIQVTGNNATYVSNSIKFAGCRVNAATNAIFATNFIEGLSCVGCDLNAVSGTGSGVAVVFNGNVRRSQILNSPQMGADGAACFQSQGVETDIDFSGNVCGRQTQPTNAVALGGTITNFNMRGNWLSGASGALARSATITGWNASKNVGIDDVIPAVGSGATLAFPVNPIFTVTGTTTATDATHPLAAGATGIFVPTSGAVAFTAGASIGNSYVAQLNVPVNYYWDGTKIWLSGQSASEIRSWCTGTVGSAQTEFLNGAACSGATTATARQVVSAPGTITGLQAFSSAAVTGGASKDVVTVFKNGSSTTITCTIAGAATSCSDTSHSVAVVAGDVITFQFVTATADTAANIAAAVYKY